MIIFPKNFWYYFLCGALSIGIAVNIMLFVPRFTTVSILKEDWGLSNFSKNQQPKGNADKETLDKYDTYYVGSEEEKVVYLTFDAGYENGYTKDLLNIMEKHNVKACFFLVGHYLETNPDIVMEMVENGHIIGNHTYSHPNMKELTTMEKFEEELVRIETIYKDITGENLEKYYRPPEGKFNESNLQMAKELGYSTIFWSLTYADWENNNQKSQEDAIDKIMSRLHNGAVILLHSTSETNALILDELITNIKNQGYTFKNIDHLTNNYKIPDVTIFTKEDL